MSKNDVQEAFAVFNNGYVCPCDVNELNIVYEFSQKEIKTIRQALQSQKAVDSPTPSKDVVVDVEGLKMHVPNYHMNRYDENWCIGFQRGFDACVDGLHRQGHLSTTERVQELEAQLKEQFAKNDRVKKSATEVRDHLLDEQEKLEQKLKVATDALKYVIGMVDKSFNDSCHVGGRKYVCGQDADDIKRFCEIYLQQIEGDRDENSRSN